MVMFVAATASGGHGEELDKPGNILQRSLKASPMGLRHRMTCKLVRTRSRKKAYRASPVSPAPSFLAAGLTSSSTPASSSLGNKLGTSPVWQHTDAFRCNVCQSVNSVMSSAAQLGCSKLLEQRMQGCQSLRPNRSMLDFGHG
jgi:hypothetical protein